MKKKKSTFNKNLLNFIDKHKKVVWMIIKIIVMISLFLTEIMLIFQYHGLFTRILIIIYATFTMLSGYFGYKYHMFQSIKVPLESIALAIFIPVGIAMFKVIPNMNSAGGIVTIIFSPIVTIILIGEKIQSDSEDNKINEMNKIVNKRLHNDIYIIGDKVIELPKDISAEQVRKEFLRLSSNSTEKSRKAKHYFINHNVNSKNIKNIMQLSKKLHNSSN